MRTARRAPLLIVIPLAGIGVATTPAAANEPTVTTTAAKDETCKRITGRMKLRILELRGVPAGTETSTTAARAVQQAMQPVFGGPKYGTAPDAQRAADRAALDADNKRLAAKGCASFDLDAALSADPRGPSPAPTVPGRK